MLLLSSFLRGSSPEASFGTLGPPVSRYSMHFAALFCSDFNKDGLHDSMIVLSASTSILVSGLGGSGFDGKLAQNSFDAPNP